MTHASRPEMSLPEIGSGEAIRQATSRSAMFEADLNTDSVDAKPPLWIAPLRALWPVVMSIATVVLLFFFVLPHIGRSQQLNISNCGIAIILAVSLTVVNGFTGQFSIGHSGFMAIGGFAAASLMYYGSYHLFGDTQFHGGMLSWTLKADEYKGDLFARGDWLFIGSLLFGAVLAGIIGWVVGLPSLRLRGDYLAIVTLGFCEIVRVVIQSSLPRIDEVRPTDPDDLVPGTTYFGDQSMIKEMWHLGGPLGFNGAPKYSSLFWVAVAVLITLAMSIRLKYSGYGRAMLSIREDEIASQAVGVNITRLKVRAFVFSAFFAGLAGALYSLRNGTIDAGGLGFQKSFDLVIVVVLGGLGSISGATIAAILLTLLPEWLREPPDLTPWHWCQGFWQFAALIAVVAVAWSTSAASRKILYSCVVGCLIWETMRREALFYQIDLSTYRMVIYSLLLIITMILRPQGLFGVQEIWDYLPVKWHWWNRPWRGAKVRG